MSEMYVGLMSGTSLDGVDAVLASFRADRSVHVHDWLYEPYPPDIRSDIESLLVHPEFGSPLARHIDDRLGHIYADATERLIQNCSTSEIRAVGCHGQTIIHRPDADPPFTWQAGNSKFIAEKTGLPVVCDFRSADMAVGGQGAPLAPAFHQHAFRGESEARAVVNIGGIANVTYLPPGESQNVIGFDTGPGNTLSNQWIKEHQDKPYDVDGNWARSVLADGELLDQLMRDEYFAVPAPKSLDHRQFSLDWLKDRLHDYGKQMEPAVVQATIAAFTARSIWRGIELWLPDVKKIFLCGGGAHNLTIADNLRAESGLEISSTGQLGIPPDQVEAIAFAWLAQRRMKNLPANIPSVTGAKEAVMLGSVIDPSIESNAEVPIPQ